MKFAFYIYQACGLICRVKRFDKLGWETLPNQREKNHVFFLKYEKVSHSLHYMRSQKRLREKREVRREGGERQREREKKEFLKPSE